MNGNKEYTGLWCNLFLVVMIITTIWWFFAELYTAYYWEEPQYRFYANAISDLGVADRHINEFIIAPEREAFSPLHQFFNIMMISQGVIYAVFVGIFCCRKQGLILPVLIGIGLILTGSVPGSTANIESGFHYIHQIGSLFPMIGGPLNNYIISRKINFTTGKVIGIVGTICGILVPVTYQMGFSAIPQRIAVYSIFLGLIVIAMRSKQNGVLPFSKE